MEEKIEINDVARWALLQKKATEFRLLQAFELFRENGIEPILIKGYAAALSYPPTKFRDSVDIDLAVAARDYDRADRLVRSDAAIGMAIDLHRELRHLDTVEWDDLFENSQVLSVDGGSIRVLRPEDHLRVVIVHWLTNGGADHDRLWDIYYMIANRPDDFDWHRFLDVVEAKRHRWLTCAVGIAERYLGLDLKGTPLEGAASDVPEWMIKTVEREWSNPTKHVPLEVSIHDRKTLVEQIFRRFRPNPIWAAVQMNASFDSRSLFFYEVISMFARIPDSYRRVSRTIRNRSK